MKHTYTIQALYGRDIELECEVIHAPETNTYPGHDEWWIENVYKNGKLIEWDVLIRYFSILYGCHMSEEEIEEIILDDYTAEYQERELFAALNKADMIYKCKREN